MTLQDAAYEYKLAREEQKRLFIIKEHHEYALSAIKERLHEAEHQVREAKYALTKAAVEGGGA